MPGIYTALLLGSAIPLPAPESISSAIESIESIDTMGTIETTKTMKTMIAHWNI